MEKLTARRKSNDLPPNKDHPDNDRFKFCEILFCNKFAKIILFVICFTLVVGYLILLLLHITRNIFPETELILNSKCANPVRNWNGKFMNFQLWETGYSSYPSYFNLHNESDYEGNDSNHKIQLSYELVPKHPVIIFGTHHKTGTFLAKKLFAKICAKMKWCCLFYVTRDSIHAIKHGLQTEPLNAMGHNQWIWNPSALDLNDYRFIHFYRHPYKKIISGYRYHADGTEEWTRKPLKYHQICRSPLLSIAKENQDGSSLHSTSNTSSTATEHITGSLSTKQLQIAIWKFCEGIHLCETCCRIEHEELLITTTATTTTTMTELTQSQGYNRTLQQSYLSRRRRLQLKNSSYNDSINNNKVNNKNRIQYKIRAVLEYKFMCEHLGQPFMHDSKNNVTNSSIVIANDQESVDSISDNKRSGSRNMNITTTSTTTASDSTSVMNSNKLSLQQILQLLPPEQGILTEAALDYYESLTMARIIHSTKNDPRTLHIDIDEMNNHYDDVIWRLLNHIRPLIVPPGVKLVDQDKLLRELQNELKFYDLSTSPIYRWSMDNPIVNHISPTTTTTTTARTTTTTTKVDAKGSTRSSRSNNNNRALRVSDSSSDKELSSHATTTSNEATTVSSSSSSSSTTSISALPLSSYHVFRLSLSAVAAGTLSSPYFSPPVALLPTTSTTTAASVSPVHLMEILRTHEEVTQLYEPILKLMESVLVTTKTDNAHHNNNKLNNEKIKKTVKEQ